MKALNFAEKLARPNILELAPYSSAREEFTGNQGMFLDANESPYNKPWNRYPDPLQQELRTRVGELKEVEKDRIILGNGSDETIDMLVRTFCRPGIDKILSISPSYGMYRVCADINGVDFEPVLLNSDFSLPVEDILARGGTHAKLLFLCSPNNPTGNRFAGEDIRTLLENFPGLVVLDEAYADYSRDASWVQALDDFPNLVVLQTLSKAWGLAAIRLGMAFAASEVIRLLMKVKPPYNVNALTQKKALQAMGESQQMKENVADIILRRDALMEQLSGIPGVRKAFPSEANFFLLQVDDPTSLYRHLLQMGVVVRDRSREPLCEGCLRISVGTAAQDEYLVQAIRGFFSGPGGTTGYPGPAWDYLEEPGRNGLCERKTTETHVRVAVNLDGSAKSAVRTGLGFLDHMLEQIPRHSGCDLLVNVKGDLHVDEHHTIEDTAIAMGEAFHQALGNKAGIERYGFALPMDDCAALVLLDFGGRPELVWKAKFRRENVGDLPTEMFAHFFKSFAVGARCNLYVKAKGQNEHHKIEAIFKALARAIRMAVKREAGAGFLPSTKGVL